MAVVHYSNLRKKKRKKRDRKGREEREKEVEGTGDGSVKPEDPREWSSEKVATFIGNF